ncbi:hypothetical protein PL263_17000 [Methylomonas sp. EFPC3]|uniref:hypothetical protein n=1 Tax=Methylomonas sp. EFPC3 TaxID=3021710 RepID=UPI0024170A39|nr:hypothetical protein [Methylomonas sp. EFPC3]WFP49786.1 hypothetical protein PL263_17000 [Methylomonas sp. EFPC3]
MQDTLAVTGNIHHLSGYISYFEHQVEARRECDNILTECPNYFAWLYISSESIYYKIKELIYFNEKDHTVFDKPYSELLNLLFSSFALSNEGKKRVLIFSKIRHLLVHKGFPNPHFTPSNTPRRLASDIPFDLDDVWNVCEKLRDPKVYFDLKTDYYLILNELDSMEINININFGNIEFYKGTS